VGWELHGLGWRPEVLSYRLSFSPGRPGLLRRLGERLGIASTEEPQRLAWEEAGPARPGAAFRSVSMDLPGLAPGEYTLRLELSTPGRGPLAVERRVVVGP
jgi:hypothetical protein